MYKRVLIFAFYISVILLASCQKEADNSNPVENTSSVLDVNIIKTSYVLNTTGMEHLDTNYVSSAYLQTVNMKIKLDKPENRGQINKIIISGNNKFGWEFFSSDLNTLYVDSIGGYIINNLIIYRTTDNYSDIFLTIKLFANDNSTNNQYEFIIKNNFMPFVSLTNSWLDQNQLKIRLENASQNSILPKTGKIILLDKNKNQLETRNIETLAVNTYYYYSQAILENIPDNAIYFYLEFHDKFELIDRNLKTNISLIADRLPKNIFYFDLSLNFEYGLYIPQKNKIILWSQSNYHLYIIDENSLKLEKDITLNYYVRNVKYSSHDQKLYLNVSSTGNYCIDLDKLTMKSIEGNSSFGIMDKYLVYKSNYESLTLYNVDNKIKVDIPGVYGSEYYYFVYNDLNKILYCASNYNIDSYLFNPDSISFTKKEYVNLSSEPGDLILHPDKTKIITLNGDIYESSDKTTNLKKLDRLVRNKNIDFSSDNKYMMGLEAGNNGSVAVTIYSTDSFTELGSTSLFYGRPIFAYCKGDKVRIVSLSNSSNNNILEEYSFDEIINSSLMSNSGIREKAYYPKKIN